jgi:chloramphenicol 3-O phosphotransferase
MNDEGAWQRRDAGRGRIILLNGASSSGKSTLAQALQAALDEPFWHFSIDHLMAARVLPKARIDSGEFPWPSLRGGFFDGFHRCLPALADAGNNLVVEHIVESSAWMQTLIGLLGHLDVFFVGVHCPLVELERRERSRGDRPIGDAKADFETTHAFALYDFEVDATLPADRNAGSIITAWTERRRPNAFDRMARRRCLR